MSKKKSRSKNMKQSKLEEATFILNALTSANEELASDIEYMTKLDNKGFEAAIESKTRVLEENAKWIEIWERKCDHILKELKKK